MKRLLLIAAVIIMAVGASFLYWLSATEKGLNWAYAQAVAWVPGELKIARLSGRLLGPLSLSDVRYRIEGTTIHIGRIDLAWTPAALLKAIVHIDRLNVSDVSVDLPSTEKVAKPAAAIVLPTVSLPIAVVLETFTTGPIRIIQARQSRFQLERTELSAEADNRELRIGRLQIVASTYRLELHGWLRPSGHYPLDIESRWQATLPDQAPVRGGGRIHGDLQQLRISQGIAQPYNADVTLVIDDVTGRLRWQGTAKVPALNPRQLNPTWPELRAGMNLQATGDLDSAQTSGSYDLDYPAIGVLNGEFRLRYLSDNVLAIDSLSIHAPATGGHVSAHGEWRPTDKFGQADLALTWQDLAWPLREPSLVHSRSGSLQVTGQPKDYVFSAAAEIHHAEFPPSDWQLSGHGNTAGVDIKRLRVALLEGEVEASGQVNWQPRLTWRAKASGGNLNPGKVSPEWPGRLGFQLTSTGELVDGRLAADLTVTQASGTLRDLPFELASELNWRDATLDIQRLAIHSGHAQLTTSGQIGADLNLAWSLQAPQLSELYPAATGTLMAQGAMHGPRDKPLLAVSLEGKDIRYQDYAAASIQTSATVDLWSWRQLQLDLEATGLRIQTIVVDALRLAAHTEEARQHVNLSLQAPGLSVDTVLTGELVGEQLQARLQRADIVSRDFGAWNLEQTTNLTVSRQALVVQPLCWRSGAGRACLEGHYKSQQWFGRVEGKALSLALLSPYLPADLLLDGVADLKATANYGAGSPSQAQGVVMLSPGSVSYPLIEGERERWAYQDGRVELELDRKGLQSRLHVTLSSGEGISGRVVLPEMDITNFTLAQPLQGSIKLAIKELGVVEALVPDIQDLYGMINTNLTLAGRLDRPVLTGQARLKDGGFRIPRLGLTITELGFTANSDGTNRISYDLAARSGDGAIKVRGETTLASGEGWPTQVHIQGDKFEVARIPEARVELTPDLTLRLKGREIWLDGEVFVPFAKLQPKDLSGAVTTSDDAVIVAGPEAPPEKWLISSRVRVRLGDRVTFYGFGFEGRIAGNITVNDEPGQPTTGTGELNVPEGRYRAYGQRLDVEHGRLLFAGGPVSNPGLDLRAVRHVGDVTAGLKVRGTLRVPQVEIFSTPSMGQTNALAYLMLGHPLEQASGNDGAMMAKAALALGLAGGDVMARSLGERFGLDEMRIETSDTGEDASLVIGRYLSPKLYVSYGAGLIQAVNTFSIRYQIAKQWQLRGEAGENQGADIFYTIER